MIRYLLFASTTQFVMLIQYIGENVGICVGVLFVGVYVRYTYYGFFVWKNLPPWNKTYFHFSILYGYNLKALVMQVNPGKPNFILTSNVTRNIYTEK